METITFYSYKGGVGRTLALSNTATYLSKFGLSVCVLDFDLEAPGLHYKFGVESHEIQRGLVDYIHAYQQQQVINDIKNYTHTIEQSGDAPITIFPAGGVLTTEYWTKLAQINWIDLLYSEEQQGVLFFLELKERIKKEINPDFLLIDSRTGVTEIAGICTTLLADKVVFLMTNNKENLEGSCQILKGVLQSERLEQNQPIEPTIVLTRIPTPKEGEHAIENKIKQNVIDAIHKIIQKEVLTDISIIHSDRQLELSETLVTNGLQKINDSNLLNDYLQLFAQLIPTDILEPKLDGFIDKIWQNLRSEPDKAQTELENLVQSLHHPKAYLSLLQLYTLRNIFDKKFINVCEQWMKIDNLMPQLFKDKYLDCFIENESVISDWTKQLLHFDLKMVIKCIEEQGKHMHNPKIKMETLFKIADVCVANQKEILAFELLEPLLNEQQNFNKQLILKLLQLYKITHKFETAKALWTQRVNEIANNFNIYQIYLSILVEADDTVSLNQLMKQKYHVRDYRDHLIYSAPELAVDVYKKLNKLSAIENELDQFWRDALSDEKLVLMHTLAKLYRKLGRFDEFKLRAEKTERGQIVLTQLGTYRSFMG